MLQRLNNGRLRLPGLDVNGIVAEASRTASGFLSWSELEKRIREYWKQESAGEAGHETVKVESG